MAPRIAAVLCTLPCCRLPRRAWGCRSVRVVHAQVVLNICDFIEPFEVANFHKDWDDVGELEQHADTFALSAFKNLQAAADEIVGFLGMEAHNNTRTVPAKAKQHTVLLVGRICTEPAAKLLVKAKVFYSTDNVVTLEFTIRGGDENIREFLTQELVS